VGDSYRQGKIHPFQPKEEKEFLKRCIACLDVLLKVTGGFAVALPEVENPCGVIRR
jgi:hypothetical protein